MNYRQLTSLYGYCIDLRELELTGVFKHIQKEIPRDFTDNLRNLALSPVAQSLEVLNLPNNYFGDHTLDALIQSVLPKLARLQYIDLSANKLSDQGLQQFFNAFVKKSKTLKGFKINYNKIKDTLTAQSIQEALNECHSLEEMSFKKCGITLDLFKTMLAMQNGYNGQGFVKY